MEQDAGGNCIAAEGKVGGFDGYNEGGIWRGLAVISQLSLKYLTEVLDSYRAAK